MKNKIISLLKFQPASELVMGVRNESLSLLLIEPKASSRCETVFLREMPDDVRASKITAFLGNRKPNRTVLMIPRSEVIQKELVLSKEKSALKGALEQRLSEILPCNIKEMSYGVSALEEEGETRKGLVFAAPEKYIKETIAPFKNAGVEIDEIITEDQALYFLLLEKEDKGNILALDNQDGRIICLLLRNSRLVFSRSFEKKSAYGTEFSDFLKDISFALIQTNDKPDKLILTGAWAKEEEWELSRLFKFSTGYIDVPKDRSAALYGMQFARKDSLVSLLPREEKIKKWLSLRRQVLKEIGLALGMFAFSLLSFFLTQSMIKHHEVEKLNRELSDLRPKVESVKQIAAELSHLQRSQASKDQVLILLRDLSQKLPADIKLLEMRVGPDEFLFKGESPSNALLAQAVQAIETIPFVLKPKLENTRLRKRLNQDYFEFEIGGSWKT